jgi:hypothetical protein
VRWIGQVSYGLYLWHWPVTIALSEPRTGISGWELAALRLAVTFGAATLSYYLIELPIRHGHRLHDWRARIAAPLGFAVVAGVIVAGTANAKPPQEFQTARSGEVLRDKPPPTTVDTRPPAAVPIPTDWVLLGDSVANSISDPLQFEAAQNGVQLDAITRPGCGLVTVEVISDDGSRFPHTAACARNTPDYQLSSVRRTSAQVVLWHSSWELGDHLVNGQVVKFDSAEGDALLEQELEAALARLKGAGVTKLVLLTYPVRAERSDIAVVSPTDLSRPPRMNRVFERFAAKHPSEVVVADLAEIVCPGGPPCPEVQDGVTLRPSDGAHYSQEGAQWLAPLLFDAIVEGLEESMLEEPSSTTTTTGAS